MKTFIFTCISILGAVAAFAQQPAVIFCDPQTNQNIQVPVYSDTRAAWVLKETLSCGQPVSLLGVENGYAKIQFGRLIGYVEGKYIRLLQTSTDTDRRIADLEAQIKALQQQPAPAPAKQAAQKEARPQAAPAQNPTPLPRTAAPESHSSFPRAELYGAYNFVYFNSNANMDGWLAAISANFKPSIGITSELAGIYGKEKTETILHTRASMYSFMAGPRFSSRAGRITLNSHVLAGVMRVGAGIDFFGARLNAAETHFLMAIGGGLDLSRPGHTVGFRLFQFDYLPIMADGWSSHVRISAGVLIRFARKQ